MADLVVVDAGSPSSPTPGTPSTLAQEVLDQAMSYLYTGVRVERDKLASGVSAGAESLTSTYSVDAIRGGSKLSVDLEDYHVWSVTGPTATVQPGEFGSTTADHATGAIIHVNAEWTPFEVFREMNNELRSLSSPSNGLMRVASVTLTYNPAFYGYDLTDVANVDDIVSVLAATTGSDRDRAVVRDWRIERNLDVATFPSGNGLFFRDGWPGRDVIVSYIDAFSPLTSLLDDVEAVSGLPYSAHDILAMGAAVRCAAPSEIDRNRMDSQGSGKRSVEVPAGARLNAIRGLAQLRQERIADEADRMRRRYPIRMPRPF